MPNDPYEFDLLVIGGGPAGEKGAAQAAYFGHRTALVEKEVELGGACINTGTLASKTLRESALFLSGFKARQLYGIDARVRSGITLGEFMHRKEYVQQRERERARKNLERHGITRLLGRAAFADPHTVVVTGSDGAARTVTADKVLIATGSVPARPAEVPFNDESVFDSDSVLRMRWLPKSMLVVGGGVIGCEYAGLFAALGIAVTLVHRSARLMDFLDAEIGAAFMRHVGGMGVTLMMEDGLERVELDGAAAVRTTLKSGKQVVAESLLYAAGRSGATAGLGLENIGIKTGKYGHVEGFDPANFRTNVPNVYAAGDVIGPPALAATSMEQARVAMCHAFDIKYKQAVSPILPYGIYSIPEISGVGETEDSCAKKGIAYVTGKSRFGDHARGQIIGDTEGMIKLIFSAPEGKLLGAHVIGEMASELVHTAMACMHFGGGVQFFIDSVFNYPTLGDVYKYAAYDALGKLNRLREGKKE